MQLVGIDIDKNATQRIECGKRFVTDIVKPPNNRPHTTVRGFSLLKCAGCKR
jgi:hypothetical protein